MDSDEITTTDVPINFSFIIYLFIELRLERVWEL